MDIESIKRNKQKITDKYGPWTAHNIQLIGEIYTIDNRVVGDEVKLRRIVQIVADMAQKPLEKLRILDLACLEGQYAIEFARRGATVVAIEGRTANIKKAQFVKEIYCLNNLELIQDDVRNLSRRKYGDFDVVLCLGILYHLDCPDIFAFINNIGEVCCKFAVIDTHISVQPEIANRYNGNDYWGKIHIEHPADATLEEREKNLWSSLDNLTSFWLTRPSLYNLLSYVGFVSVYECHLPEEIEKAKDRITLLALKGERQELICCPPMNRKPNERIPEIFCNDMSLNPFGRLHKLAKYVPGPVKERIKEWLYK
jgi:SAM-dependent methyltransferase